MKIEETIEKLIELGVQVEQSTTGGEWGIPIGYSCYLKLRKLELEIHGTGDTAGAAVLDALRRLVERIEAKHRIAAEHAEKYKKVKSGVAEVQLAAMVQEKEEEGYTVVVKRAPTTDAELLKEVEAATGIGAGFYVKPDASEYVVKLYFILPNGDTIRGKGTSIRRAVADLASAAKAAADAYSAEGKQLHDVAEKLQRFRGIG